LIVLLPEPLALALMFIQLTLLAAVQLQLNGAVTAMFAVSPPAPIEAVSGEIAVTQVTPD